MRRLYSRTIQLFLAGIVLLTLFGTSVVLQPPLPAKAANYRYVGSFFNKTSRTLMVVTSSDALNFSILYNGGFKGIGATLRDPSIYRHTDGKFYVAYTATNDTSCCNPENQFGIAVSSDLVNWSNFITVPAGVSGVINTWAPDWFIDSNGTVNLIVNINTTANAYRSYKYTALNSALTSWSGPVAIGIGPNNIDTTIVKVGGTYHAFSKNETTTYIEHATSPSLTGPWTWVGTGNWAGWGSHKEGPSIIKLDNGKWRMLLDTYSTTGYVYSDGNSDFTGWTSPTNLPAVGSQLTHGTVLDLGNSTGPTLTPTRTPTAPTPTPTRTPTGPTPTATRTPTPGNGPTCSPVTATISAPFAQDGVGAFCWQSSNLGSYVNSWNLAQLTINGVNFTNVYVAAGSLPAKINTFWFVTYTSTVSWGHFETK
jgi:hypothetical protein